MPGDWLFAVITLLILTHLFLLAFAIYRGRKRAIAMGDTESDTRTDDRGADTTDDGIICPTCKTRNDRGYRYCRECVSELPTGVPVTAESVGGESRRTL
jgi:hypothetical protein